MLEKLEIRNVSVVGKEVNFSCPFPGHTHGDENPSAYMNIHTTEWICHGCKRRGSAVSFVAEHEGVSPVLAIRFLRERYDSTFREPEGGSMVKELEALLAREQEEKEQPLTPISMKNIERFYVNWPQQWKMHENKEASPYAQYMFNRGFEPGVLEDWDIGWDFMSRRITIPYYGPTGLLYGFKARALEGDDLRYLVLGDRKKRGDYGFNPIPVSKFVFGLQKAKKLEQAILCEGELNVVSMHQKGFNHSVGISGSWLSEYQSQLLTDHFDEVILLFDSDEAGNEGALRAIELLEKKIRVAVCPTHEGDPAMMTTDEIDDTISAAKPSISATLNI